MSFAAIATAISSGVESWDKIDKVFSDRKNNEIETKQLAEIIGYLDQIQDDILHIKNQNDEILQLLRNLPDDFRRISKNANAENTLIENRAVLKIRRLEFLGRPDGLIDPKGWWTSITGSFGIISAYEERPEVFTEILINAEIIHLGEQVVNEVGELEDPDGIIKKVLGDYKNDWIEAMDRATNAITLKLGAWKLALDNSSYIASHNFSEDTSNIQDVIWQPQPNRNKTIEEIYPDCVTSMKEIEIGDGRTILIPEQECVTKTRTITVVDSSFNEARNQWVKSIKAQRENLLSDLKNLAGIQTIISRVENYLTTLA